MARFGSLSQADRQRRLAKKAVGVLEFDPEDPTVQKIELKMQAKVLVLDQSTHVTERRTCTDPKRSPFIRICGLQNTVEKGVRHYSM